LFLAELEGRQIRWRRDRLALRVAADGVVDARELRLRVLLRELRQVIGEDEADADDDVHPLGCKESKAGFAIGAFARLDEAHARAQLTLGPFGAEVGAIVE